MESEEIKQSSTVVPKRGRKNGGRNQFEQPDKVTMSFLTKQMADGSIKVKYFKHRHYKGGYIKSELIGLEKDKKMIFGVKE